MTVRIVFVLLLAALAMAACDKETPAHDPGTTADTISRVPASTDSGRTTGVKSDTSGVIIPPNYNGHKYGVRSARVIYYNLRTQGFDTLFFDGYGEREAYYSAPTRATATTPSILHIAIYDGTYFYQLDAASGVGKKIQSDNPEGPILGFIPDIFKASGERAAIFQLRKIEPRTFLGKESAGFTFEYAARHNLWLWNGIPMYDEWTTHEKPPETLSLEAKILDIDVAIPAARFAPGPKIKLVESDGGNGGTINVK